MTINENLHLLWIHVSATTYRSIIELTLQPPNLVLELRFISSFLHGFLCPLSLCLYSLLILLSVILSNTNIHYLSRSMKTSNTWYFFISLNSKSLFTVLIISVTVKSRLLNKYKSLKWRRTMLKLWSNIFIFLSLLFLNYIYVNFKYEHKVHLTVNLSLWLYLTHFLDVCMAYIDLPLGLFERLPHLLEFLGGGLHLVLVLGVLGPVPVDLVLQRPVHVLVLRQGILQLH